MLAAFGATAEFNAPITAMLETLTVAELASGTRLGAWTLERKIGEGGMGTVYAARRSDGHFDQEAAVKLLRGVPSAAALEYLARERQILASLTHPNIARLLDGGATPQGQPYLVMEYLDGVPIDRYCREQRPDALALLRLLIPVCEAVAYAHARLVVHCDLKPSNILVRGDKSPCLLDFGIARVLGDAGRAQPSSISRRARAFTPGFASPEQEAGGAISTASDVYSLGRLMQHLAECAGIALDRELGALIVCATAVDPSARYDAAAKLAQEMQRYLDCQPLQAMAPRLAYRGRKWLQRRWPLALAGTLFALTVVGFTWQLARDRDRALAAEHAALTERDRAAAAEQASRQISEFLVSMLDGVNPDAGGDEVPLSTLVQQALARIDRELAGQPAVQAELYATLADVQTELRIPEQAQSSFEKSIALERTLGRPLVLARLLGRLARHLRSNGSAEAAAKPAREALELYRGMGAHAPAAERVRATSALGAILLDTPQTDEGLLLLRQAVTAAEAIDPAGTLLAQALLDLGGKLHELDQLAESERLLRRGVAIFDKHSEDELSALNAREVLARLLVSRKQMLEAESLLRAALERRRALQGVDDVNIPWRLSELGRLLDDDGRSLQALPLFAEAVTLAERKFGADGVHHAVLLQNQARCQFRAGAFAEAEANYRRALADLSRHWGEQNPGIATIRTNLGMLLLASGKPDEAWRQLQAAEQILAARRPGNPRDLALSRILLAQVDLLRQRIQDARRWLELVEGVDLGAPSAVHAEFLRAQALVLATQPDDSATLAAFGESEAAWDAAIAAGSPRAVLVRLDRAEWLAGRGDAAQREQAQTLAAEVLAQIDDKLVSLSPWRARIARLQR
jgi:serine/threonine-protein kinase